MNPKIEAGLSEIKDEISKMNVILVRQEEHLKAHMKRSETNEEAVAILDRSFQTHQLIFAAHMARLELVMKIIGGVGLAVVAAALKVLLS